MRTSFRHQSEAQPPNGPLTAAASPDTPSLTPATQSALQRLLPPDLPEVGDGNELFVSSGSFH
jgi:hypothetical protein